MNELLMCVFKVEYLFLLIARWVCLLGLSFPGLHVAKSSKGVTSF